MNCPKGIKNNKTFPSKIIEEFIYREGHRFGSSYSGSCGVEHVLLTFPQSPSSGKPKLWPFVGKTWQDWDAEAKLWNVFFQQQHLGPWLTSWLISCLRAEASRSKCRKQWERQEWGLDISYLFINSNVNWAHCQIACNSKIQQGSASFCRLPCRTVLGLFFVSTPAIKLKMVSSFEETAWQILSSEPNSRILSNLDFFK